MPTSEIKADHVRDTLRALRVGRPIEGSPLLACRALAQLAREEGLGGSEESLRHLLGLWLTRTIEAELHARRRERGTRPPTSSTAGAAQRGAAPLEALRADMASADGDRQALGILHARYVAMEDTTLAALATRLGLSRRTIRRRQSRGYSVLSEALRLREEQARAQDERQNGEMRGLRFIGRERERGEVRALLARHPLVTLTGPGGIGKSRMALELLHDLGPDYRDASLWIELGGEEDGRRISLHIAEALELRVRDDADPLSALRSHLREGQRLLVLDNAEHLAVDLARVAASLLAACPELQLLVTSRAPLGLPTESAYRVPPLALPEPRVPLQRRQLLHVDAVRLFLDRARRSAPSLELDDESAPHVVAICHRLGGLPLAIELAAAQLGQLPLVELHARLDHGQLWLSADQAGLREVHRSLHASILSSLDLIDQGSRRALACLSVLRGDASISTASALIQDPASDRVGADAEAVLDSLVEHSLVEKSGTGPGTRVRLLEPIRDVAAGQLLALGEAVAVRERLLDAYLGWAEELSEHLLGPAQQEWLARIRAEEPNLRAVLRWARRPRTAERGLWLAVALSSYYRVRGRFREGLAMITGLLETEGADVPAQVLAEARRVAGGFALQLDDLQTAGELLDQALVDFRRLDDRPGMARTLNNLALVEVHRGKLEQAIGCLRESIALKRELEDERGLADSLTNLAIMYAHVGDKASAEACYEEAEPIMRALGDDHALADLLSERGNRALGRRDLEAARRLYEESLALRRALDDRHGLVAGLMNLGNVPLESGDPAAALALFQESLAVSRELGGRGTMIRAAIGEAHVVAGHPERARPFLVQALRGTLEDGTPWEQLEVLELLGRLESAAGCHEHALRVLAASAATRAAEGLPISPMNGEHVERAVARSRAALEPERAERAWREGASCTATEIAVEILGRADLGREPPR